MVQATPAGWDENRRFIALYGTAIGMMVLHQSRIIHRDLKPDNVLLTDRFEPKVADFGLSKIVERGATFQQTIHGGTPRYMAPEIYEGERYAFPVDVYAFGVLVYTCITLATPFAGIDNLYELGSRVVHGERPTIPEWVGQKWGALITRCWSGDPSNRPTFEDIVREMGSVDFIDDAIDKRVVRAYQLRTLPEEFHLPE
jgi:serine/threonine protein kinase